MFLGRKNLHGRLLNTLGARVQRSSDVNVRPLEIDLSHPLPSKVRVYLFTLTHPPGGRTVGEHKIQIILPGQRRGERGEIDFGGSRFVVLAGLEPERDVFVLWDARNYRNVPHSRNVQVKAATVNEAYAQRLATQERSLWGGARETIVACTGEGLVAALQLRFELSLG